MREGAGGRGHRRGPSSVAPCLPDPAPATPAGRGTPGGAAPHRNRPSLLYTRQGRSARGRSPGALPTCPLSHQPAGRGAQGSPALSPPPQERPSSARQPQLSSARRDTATPLATGHVPRGAPPISAARTRLPERLETFSLLSTPPGSGSSRSSATGPSPRSDEPRWARYRPAFATALVFYRRVFPPNILKGEKLCNDVLFSFIPKASSERASSEMVSATI